MRSGGVTRMVTAPWSTKVGSNLDDWKMLAAETINGVNQILWRYKPTRQIHLWTLDANWAWQSSSPLIDRSSTQTWDIETGFQLDLNNDTIIGAPFSTVENVGNTTLLRRADGRAFVESAGGGRQSVSSPWGADAGTNSSDWRMLAAENVGGRNQILWRYRPTRQVHVWTLDANWAWQSSSALIDRTGPQAWDLETAFQLDLTNDTIIGAPFSTVESLGNTTLLRRGDDHAFVQSAGGTRQIVSSPWGAGVGNATSQWQMLGAETIAGANTILWRYSPTDQINLWALDGSWTWQSSSPLINRSSPQTWAIETGFQMDLNNDGRIGQPL
ncbi:MAG: hypothetical protein ACKOYK_08550 [Cyanobium sp.]